MFGLPINFITFYLFSCIFLFVFCVGYSILHIKKRSWVLRKDSFLSNVMGQRYSEVGLAQARKNAHLLQHDHLPNEVGFLRLFVSFF